MKNVKWNKSVMAKAASKCGKCWKRKSKKSLNKRVLPFLEITKPRA